tara:strand:- start:1218 stop:1643 length:426 start_codon:yes stop_codon:yes gene_type:complete
MTLPAKAAEPNSENLQFFEGAEQGRLVLPRCTACGFVIWFPREICPECGSQDVDWFEASGNGSIYSCTVTRRIPGSWGKAAPFVLAYVELDEGPRVMTNIVDCDPEQVAIGDRVKAVFEEATDRDGNPGPPLLRFRPVEAQ